MSYIMMMTPQENILSDKHDKYWYRTMILEQHQTTCRHINHGNATLFTYAYIWFSGMSPCHNAMQTFFPRDGTYFPRNWNSSNQNILLKWQAWPRWRPSEHPWIAQDSRKGCILCTCKQNFQQTWALMPKKIYHIFLRRLITMYNDTSRSN